MSMLSENGSVHRQTWDLLPWVVNDTASESDRAVVAEHLQACADCREELAFQRRLHAAMAPQLAARSDPRGSWEELRARLNTRASMSVARRAETSSYRMSWLTAAMVVEAVVIGALSTALWWRAPPAGTAGQAQYRTLSSPEKTTPAASIRVVLAPGTTLEQMQSLLAAAHLQVVSGPSEAGVWSLGPAAEPSQAATATALRQLRADPSVRFAEPIAASPPEP
jgi:hypothetical protein